MSLFPSSSLVISSLSLSIFPSHCPFFLPVSTPLAAILPLSVSFLCSFLSSLFAVCCCRSSALSGSGSSEKLTKTVLPGFAGSRRLWSWDLNIHIYLHSRGMEGEMKGGMLGTGARRWRRKERSHRNKSQNDMTCSSLLLITTLTGDRGTWKTEKCLLMWKRKYKDRGKDGGGERNRKLCSWILQFCLHTAAAQD